MRRSSRCATNYTAYQFFNNKQAIAVVMQIHMNKYFTENLCATVESVQINEDDLPEEFLDAILASAEMRQNITRVAKIKEAREVEFTTARIVAAATANRSIAASMGVAARHIAAGKAKAEATKLFTEAQGLAYKQIKDGMKLTPDGLLDYMCYDILSGGSIARDGATKVGQVFYGIDPAAMVYPVN